MFTSPLASRYPAPARRLLAILIAAFVLLQTVFIGEQPAVAQEGKIVRVPFFANPNTTIFINEIHYDNTSTDTQEGVEVAGPAGTDLTGWTIVPYNGNTPSAAVTYTPIGTLSGTIPNQQNGYGTVYVSIAGLQNGPNDGLALVNSSNQVIQLLSYEGAFTAASGATGGPAAGMTATDIGVSQGGTQSDAFTLQLQGTGNIYANFTWAAGVAATRGAVNTGQTFTAPPPPAPALSINNVSQNEGNAGTSTFTFTVSLSAPAGPSGVTFDICTADGTAQDDNPATEDNDYTAQCLTGQTIPAGSSTYAFNVSVNGDTSSEANETFFVNVTNVTVATITDGQGQGTITNDDVAPCGASFTPTYTIQGSSSSSPMAGSTVSTEGIVTGDFQTSSFLSGFYIQDPSGDGNTATSDGLFIFDGASPSVNVSVGDRVRVMGTVLEFNGLTELSPVTSVQICNTGNTPPAATAYDLPEPTNGDFERLENMLVTFPETLTVTGNHDLGQFGELVLSSEGRLFQRNNFHRPTSPESSAIAALNQRRYVLLDDGRSGSNPDPTPYFNLDNTRRLGDTVANLTGVLTFSFSEYRVQPTVTPAFVSANPRTPTPGPVGGNVKISSFNVLNYFTTLDAGANDDRNPDGGNTNPAARGADNATEFARQRDKIVAALQAIDADVYGLIELENNNNSPNNSPEAIDDLVAALNTAYGSATYQYAIGSSPGTDAIMNGIIYKPARVTPVGAAVNDTDPVWAGQARNPLAQTFTLNSNGEKFTFIVNHFTSKACGNEGPGDTDAGDGQGCDNLQRTLQAARLLQFIEEQQVATGDPDVLVMGDLNAYGEEDPIFKLETDPDDALNDGTGGLVDLVQKFVPAASRYSYQFDNYSGYLDHALSTKELDPYVSGTTIWHINADEPTVLDYNLENKSAAKQAINVGTPYRSSDHDPVIVGLNLVATAAQLPGSLIISEFRFRGAAGANDEFIELYNNTTGTITVSTLDGSAGWAVVGSDGVARCTIPNQTDIPARGHFLCVNSTGYSLANYGGPNAADGDAPYTTGIPDDGGVALFRTSLPANFTEANRLDAAGFTTAPALYREGTGINGFPTVDGEFSHTRLLNFGTPQDTGVNNADFLYIAINADVVATSNYGSLGVGPVLGAPGPEESTSPVLSNDTIKARLIDATVSSGAAPNRERKSTCEDVDGGPVCPPQAPNGTLVIRRRFTNNTGNMVTRLRFRVVDITTKGSPDVSGGAQQADLRVLSSADNPTGVGITSNDPSICSTLPPPQGLLPPPCAVPVQGVTLEQPPTQANGGGYNSSVSVDVGGGIPAGGTVDVQFTLGVMVSGKFRFFANVEAVFLPQVTVTDLTLKPLATKPNVSFGNRR